MHEEGEYRVGPMGVDYLFVMDSLMTVVGYMEVAGIAWFGGPLDEHWSYD